MHDEFEDETEPVPAKRKRGRPKGSGMKGASQAREDRARQRAVEATRPDEVAYRSHGTGYQLDNPTAFEDATAALTPIQRRYVYFYLTEAKGVSAVAARMAGYAEGSSPHHTPSVRTAISAGLKTAGLSCEEVLSQLAEMATSNMGDFLDIDGFGRCEIDLKKANKLGKLHLIKRFSEGKNGPTIELYDKSLILIQLGKWAGLMEKSEVEVTEKGGRDGLAEKLEALAARLKAPITPPANPALVLSGPQSGPGSADQPIELEPSE